MMPFVLIVSLVGLFWPVVGLAQSRFVDTEVSSVLYEPSAHPLPADNMAISNHSGAPETQPMSPEIALQTYQRRTMRQASERVSYSATTVIHADLLDTLQEGEYELQRTFMAPHMLQFKAVQYRGDVFVKSNVIVRLLQSEANHVRNDDPALTAIDASNYKFSSKGQNTLEGRTVYVFQVKPHRKRLGLFKGHIYLDAMTGALVRAEGKPVKSPSFFIKKIEFVRDYASILSLTLPIHVHFEARALVVGRTIIDVAYSHFRPVSIGGLTASQ